MRRVDYLLEVLDILNVFVILHIICYIYLLLSGQIQFGRNATNVSTSRFWVIWLSVFSLHDIWAFIAGFIEFELFLITLIFLAQKKHTEPIFHIWKVVTFNHFQVFSHKETLTYGTISGGPTFIQKLFWFTYSTLIKRLLWKLSTTPSVVHFYQLNGWKKKEPQFKQYTNSLSNSQWCSGRKQWHTSNSYITQEHKHHFSHTRCCNALFHTKYNKKVVSDI